MTIKVGDKLPEAKFTTFNADGPTPITTDEVFKGKRVALFAVPGAFTPTCSAKHLPGFKQHAAELEGQGRRHHRLRLGQRRLRDEGLGRGPGRSATTS